MVIGTLYGFLVELSEDASDVTHASTVSFSTFVMFQVPRFHINFVVANIFLLDVQCTELQIRRKRV